MVFGHIVDDIIESTGNSACKFVGFFAVWRRAFSLYPADESRVFEKFGNRFSVKIAEVAFGELVHYFIIGFRKKDIRSLAATKKRAAVNFFRIRILIGIHKLAEFFGAFGSKSGVAFVSETDFLFRVFGHSVANKMDSVSYHISS
jgi:hypothetical protein